MTCQQVCMASSTWYPRRDLINSPPSFQFSRTPSPATSAAQLRHPHPQSPCLPPQLDPSEYWEHQASWWPCIASIGKISFKKRDRNLLPTPLGGQSLGGQLLTPLCGRRTQAVRGGTRSAGGLDPAGRLGDRESHAPHIPWAARTGRRSPPGAQRGGGQLQVRSPEVEDSSAVLLPAVQFTSTDAVTDPGYISRKKLNVTNG